MSRLTCKRCGGAFWEGNRRADEDLCEECFEREEPKLLPLPLPQSTDNPFAHAISAPSNPYAHDTRKTMGIYEAVYKGFIEEFALPPALLKEPRAITATEVMARIMEIESKPPTPQKPFFVSWSYKTTMRQEWKKYHRARRQLAKAMKQKQRSIVELRKWRTEAPPALKGNYGKAIAQLVFELTYPPIVVAGPRLGAAMVQNRRIRRYLP